MAKKTYRGSCICKRVTFEADIDLAEVGTGKCNCSFCFKRRWWSVRVATDGFRALQGEDTLVKSDGGSGTFCPSCGIVPFGRVPAAEWNDGAYVSVNVAALDNLEPAELVAAPVQFMDGRADNWWHPPAETRHL
jgi:hypothetical protein